MFRRKDKELIDNFSITVVILCMFVGSLLLEKPLGMAGSLIGCLIGTAAGILLCAALIWRHRSKTIG